LRRTHTVLIVSLSHKSYLNGRVLMGVLDMEILSLFLAIKQTE